jgi:hypothetical protein
VLGGYGQTSSVRGYPETSILILFPYTSGLIRYEASYQRYFAQTYIAWVEDPTVVTLGVRATHLRFQRLTRNELPVKQAARLYLEPQLQLSYKKGNTLQGNFGFGISLPVRSAVPEADASLTRIAPMVSIGLLWSPHWLGYEQE